jgi:hypothetical protein
MIIARLTPKTDPDGRRYLVGQTVSSWPLAVGTRLVLRRRGDEYVLLELATRAPDYVNTASFVSDESN